MKEEQERIEKEEKVPKSERMTAEKRITQEIAEDKARKEEIRRKTHTCMTKEEAMDKMITGARRESPRKKKFAQNFYALDTETTSLKCPDLIEVAAILYKNGEAKKVHKEKYMPRRRITKEAESIHGLSKLILMMLECEYFSKEASDRLSDFLHEEEDLPIVAHWVHFDRDMVLMPAFKKVENDERMPEKTRWRCTYEMARLIPEIEWRNLD